MAAKIGQSLLQQNKHLEARIEMIEEQLTVINDMMMMMMLVMLMMIMMMIHIFFLSTEGEGPGVGSKDRPVSPPTEQAPRGQD